mmetsp:Transcript_35366/g.82686  ORF Transcript_35366/g.82686 Transcript_35366/m.82686 type:complete len:266 (+) Transcript_35366:87-884(+)
MAAAFRQQLAKCFESDSRRILRECQARRDTSSFTAQLDATLKDSHNMRVFGVGTLASMASRARYARFTASMLHVYSAMEAELDLCSPSKAAAVHQLWEKHEATLRRRKALEADLQDVAAELPDGGQKATPRTQEYVDAIRAAAQDDRSSGGIRLLSHVYCRYFADLFGGQMLAAPYRIALDLQAQTPRHYSFDFQDGNRQDLILAIYNDLSHAGDMVSPDAQSQAVQECRSAFHHNVQVFSEEPYVMDAAKASCNVVTGFFRGRR